MSVSRLCTDDIGIITVHNSVVLNDYILTATQGNIIINGTPLNIISTTGGSTITYLNTGDTQGYLSFFQDTTGSTLNFADLMYSKTNLASFISTTDGNTSLQFLNGASGALVLDSFDQYITLSNGETNIHGGAGGSIEMLFSGSSVSLSSGNFMAPYTNFTLSNTYITGNLNVTNQINASAISSANFIGQNITSSNLILNSILSSTNSSSGGLVSFGGLSINCFTNAVNVSNGGALTVAGGASIAGNLIVGGNISYANASQATNTYAYLTLTASDPSDNLANGALVSFGGVSIQNTFDATSTTSGGALTIAGGIAIGKNVFIGGKINSTSLSTGNTNVSNLTAGNINVSNLTAENINVPNLTVGNTNVSNLSTINLTAGNLYMNGDTINGTTGSFLQLNSVHSKLVNGVNSITINNTANSIIISTNKLVHSMYDSVVQSITGTFNTDVQTNNSYIGDIILDTTALLAASTSISFNVLNTNVNSKQIQLSFRYQGITGLPYIYISGFTQDVSFTVNIVNLDTNNSINGSEVFVIGYQITN
jgi:hypothetical protein